MLFCRPLCDASYVSLPGKRAAASRLCEKATSPFSPSLRLWKPWKTEKRFTHRSRSLRSPSFSSLAFSLYKEKFPFSIPKTHSCHDEQRAACQYGKEKQTAHRRFYPQKKPKRNIKEAQHHAVQRDVGLRT